MGDTTYSTAQRAILSIILNHGSEAMEVADKYLEEPHFTELRYKMMWRNIKWLYDNDHEINEITVENSMLVNRDSTGQVVFDLLNPRTGEHRQELMAIKEFRTNDNISCLNSYMDIILDKFQVEKYLDMGTRIVEKAKGGKATAGQLQSIVNSFYSFFTQRDRKQPRSLMDIAETLIQKNKASDEGDQSVIHPNIHALNDYVWFTPGNQTVIAGDTGHGKTSLALQIAWNIAKQKKKVIDLDTGKPLLNDAGKEVWSHRRVLFFSLEMSEGEMLSKLCCIENNITMQYFMTKISPKEKIEMLEAFKKSVALVAPNFYIDYTADTLKDVENKCRQLYNLSGGLDLVVVDYLQLLAEVKEAKVREDQKYREASRFLKKRIAGRMETHTIVLSQLNTAPKDATGATMHRPTLERLFGSSAMKQDATHVIFVYREWAVEIKNTTFKNETISSLYVNRILLAKHRFGNNQVELVLGFIPYLSYFVPFKVIRDANLHTSKDATIVFPKITEFMEESA